MKSARKHRTTTLARSLCRVCAKTWEGANAQAVAARHTDATSHATRVEVNMVVEYGEEPEKQPGLFDGVMAETEATSDIASPDYPTGGTPWL